MPICGVSAVGVRVYASQRGDRFGGMMQQELSTDDRIAALESRVEDLRACLRRQELRQRFLEGRLAGACRLGLMAAGALGAATVASALL